MRKYSILYSRLFHASEYSLRLYFTFLSMTFIVNICAQKAVPLSHSRIIYWYFFWQFAICIFYTLTIFFSFDGTNAESVISAVFLRSHNLFYVVHLQLKTSRRCLCGRRVCLAIVQYCKCQLLHLHPLLFSHFNWINVDEQRKNAKPDVYDRVNAIQVWF